MLEKTEAIQSEDRTTPDDLAAEFLDKRSSGETADESALRAFGQRERRLGK